MVSKLSEVIKKLLLNAGISEAELARRTTMPTATLNKLKTGTIDDPRLSTLQTIANYFDITIDQLIGKQPILNNIVNEKNKIVKVPILQQHDLIRYVNHSLNNNLSSNSPDIPDIAQQNNEYNEYIMVDIDCDEATYAIKDKLFAIQVLGESMYPRFEDNSLIICSTLKKAQNRDFVISYIKSSNTFVFRQIFLDVQMMILKAINPDFSVIQMSQDDYIMGVVIQVIKKY
jgi:SOS-response transcriptional repressor LexA/DNA-binding Xre family transcriptional regulator